jgi:hypothetical protein
MTQIVPVSPGLSSVIVSGPQYGVKYTLTGPDGARVVFNDKTDANYVGFLSNISGLDSPDVRESADDLIGDDGGVHGLFFYGRRPIVIEGYIDNTPSPYLADSDGNVLTENGVRNARMTMLQRVTNAMRRDLEIRWQPEGGVEQMVRVRRQQPLRIAGAYNKSFQAALVAADPRIYGTAINEIRFDPNVDSTATNKGTMRTPPTATVYGPTSGTMTGIEIHNHTTGEYIVFAPSYALAPGQYIVVDFVNKTITRESGLNIYDKLVFASSTWFQIEPGDNTIAVHGTGTTTGASMVLRWQDAWV